MCVSVIWNLRSQRAISSDGINMHTVYTHVQRANKKRTQLFSVG